MEAGRTMEVKPPEDVAEPKLGRLWLLFLRGLNLVSFVLVIWNIQRVGLLAALAALCFPLAAWWLRPSTLKRGLAISIGAGLVVGSIAAFPLLLVAVLPPSYFDLTPEEVAALRGLKLVVLLQAALVTAATSTYFRTKRPP